MNEPKGIKDDQHEQEIGDHSSGNTILQNTLAALTRYTWDQENRLTSIAAPTLGITIYLYSDDGKRQATINSTGTTNFVWGNDVVLQETSAGVTSAGQSGEGKHRAWLSIRSS